MISLAVAALLAAGAGDERLAQSEAAFTLSYVGVGYGHAGGRFGDAYWNRGVDGRFVWPAFGLTFDATLVEQVPLSGEGPAGALLAVPRVGYTGRRWQLLAGVSLQVAPAATPQLQLFPSVHAAYDFGPFGLEGGLFEEQSLALAEILLRLGDFSIGYVAPFGAVVHARFRLMSRFGLRFSALAFRLANADVGMLNVALVYGPSAGTAR